MTEELKSILEERAIVYGFLARIYRKEVDHEFLSAMKAIDYSMFDPENEGDKHFINLYKCLDKQEDTLLLDLARDYARTFLGAGLGNHTAAHPYESYYTNPDRMLMQEARDEVMFAYGDELLQKSDKFAEHEDHMAFEMEFMAYLIKKALGASNEAEEKKYMDKQHDFFFNHINKWAEMFIDNVIAVSNEDFYKEAAHITRGHIFDEREFFGSL